MSKKYFWVSLLIVLLFSFVVLFLYYKFNTTGYLSFSDSAKSADIARSVISGSGYHGTFSFWSSGILDSGQRNLFPSPWLPPLMPYSIALSFLLFGVSDFSALIVSAFYFVLLVIFTYLLGQKLFSNTVGVLSAVVVSSSIDFLNYATNSGTESLFTFEIIASAYFLSLKNKWATFVGFVLMSLMYFTRPQGFIYIAGLMLYWLLITFKPKKAVFIFIILLILGFLVDYFVLSRFAGKYFLYSVTGRGISTATQISAGGSASNSLRGEVITTTGILTVIKKLFYNLYNYYKLLPQILSPYLFAFFMIGVFKWSKDRFDNSLKISTLFMFLVTTFVSALSIPFFRYIHPIVPLIYLFSVSTIVSLFKNYYIPAILIFIFIVGQSLGVILLDSRFIRNTKNMNKPPVYVMLSEKLKENTKDGDVIVTNLDTWGSWYGERTTVWFPIKPEMLHGEKFDAIYLTSYKIDDQNYYMGDGWREIFENPENQKTLPSYKFVKKFEINASENYERLDARSILFVRKQ